MLPGWQLVLRTKTGLNISTAYNESLPDGHKVNLPNPKPPSLGWPRSLTPHPLTISIHERTSSSFPSETKSKKGRPTASLDDTNLLLEECKMVLLIVNRSRMSAARIDFGAKPLEGGMGLAVFKLLTRCAGGNPVEVGEGTEHPGDEWNWESRLFGLTWLGGIGSGSFQR
jgi:hypothetical protein